MKQLEFKDLAVELQSEIKERTKGITSEKGFISIPYFVNNEPVQINNVPTQK